MCYHMQAKTAKEPERRQPSRAQKQQVPSAESVPDGSSSGASGRGSVVVAPMVAAAAWPAGRRRQPVGRQPAQGRQHALRASRGHSRGGPCWKLGSVRGRIASPRQQLQAVYDCRFKRPGLSNSLLCRTASSDCSADTAHRCVRGGGGRGPCMYLMCFGSRSAPYLA